MELPPKQRSFERSYHKNRLLVEHHNKVREVIAAELIGTGLAQLAWLKRPGHQISAEEMQNAAGGKAKLDLFDFGGFMGVRFEVVIISGDEIVTRKIDVPMFSTTGFEALDPEFEEHGPFFDEYIPAMHAINASMDAVHATMDRLSAEQRMEINKLEQRSRNFFYFSPDPTPPSSGDV